MTVWPLPHEVLCDPLALESAHSPARAIKDLDAVISILQPGVEEISRKCGSKPARRLQAVLQKLRYIQYDALKGEVMLRHMFDNM